MNLIEDRWIPVQRLNGDQERIAPWELTSDFQNNPVVSLAAPRPDFKGGLMQFLIGLVQTSAPPDEREGPEWEDWLEEPPAPEVLRETFAPYVDCFNLDGDGPRFMQDLELREGKDEPVSGLLIDSPGENTQKNNADHFVKRGRVESMCLPCVATALFSLQTNAPSGGAGHRTSLRGGGPLTTLIVLDPQGSGMQQNALWYNIWLNILDKRVYGSPQDIDANKRNKIFPWLGITRTSEPPSGCATYSNDVHPLHMYWAMPRRLWLDIESRREVACDICSINSSTTVNSYITRPWGFNYRHLS